MAKKVEQPFKDQHGEYEFVNGRMYHGYQRYKNGAINMSRHLSSFEHLSDDISAIHSMWKFFNDFIIDRQSKYEKRKRQFWHDYIAELKLIDPTYDADKYVYGIDPETGFLTRDPKPAPIPDGDA